MSEKYFVTVWNTISRQYEETAVSKEIYDEYRRGEWRISKNNDKHHNGEIPFSALIGGENGNYENFSEFISDETNPEKQILNECSKQDLHKAITSLDPFEQALIQAVFFDGLTMRKCAEKFHIPLMTIQDRKIRVLKKLKKFLE